MSTKQIIQKTCNEWGRKFKENDTDTQRVTFESDSGKNYSFSSDKNTNNVYFFKVKNGVLPPNYYY